MTKHETLAHMVNTSKPLSKKDLSEHFPVRYVTASEAVNRYYHQGLVSPVRKKGKEIFYGLTGKGKERLEYFEHGGCSNLKCSCQT